MLQLFAQGFQQMGSLLNVGMVAFGVFLGVVFGCVPGLNGNTALVLVLPLSYSAILLNIPGAASNVATQFDGSPMARKGEAGKALGTGIFYSFLGSLIGFAALFFLSGPVAKIAINFGKADYFWMAFFALTMVISLSSKNLWKGLAVACLGLLCSFIGASEVDGTTRMTMGMHALDAGINLIPALIGIYAVGELINASKSFDKRVKIETNYKIRGFGFTWQEFKEQFVNMLTSGVVGAFIGILPGIGGMTANLVAYSVSKSTSKHPEKYGTGYMGGVVASETANNACVGGAMIPLFALGIPGDTFTAVMLGVMMVHGLQPGPLVMTKNADFIYGIFVALLLANIFCVILQYFGIKLFVRMLAVPKHILLPIIMVLSLVGAIAVNNRIFDAWIVLIFGVVGIIMNKLEFPITPIILGFILGPLAETNLRRALMVSKGQLLPIISNTPSIILITLSVLSLILAPRLLKREAKAQAEMEALEAEQEQA